MLSLFAKVLSLIQFVYYSNQCRCLPRRFMSIVDECGRFEEQVRSSNDKLRSSLGKKVNWTSFLTQLYRATVISKATYMNLAELVGIDQKIEKVVWYCQVVRLQAVADKRKESTLAELKSWNAMLASSVSLSGDGGGGGGRRPRGGVRGGRSQRRGFGKVNVDAKLPCVFPWTKAVFTGLKQWSGRTRTLRSGVPSAS